MNIGSDVESLEEELSINLTRQALGEYDIERAKIMAAALYNYGAAILSIAVAAPIVGYIFSPSGAGLEWRLAGVPAIGLICMAALHTAAQTIIRSGYRR